MAFLASLFACLLAAPVLSAPAGDEPALQEIRDEYGRPTGVGLSSRHIATRRGNRRHPLALVVARRPNGALLDNVTNSYLKALDEPPALSEDCEYWMSALVGRKNFPNQTKFASVEQFLGAAPETIERLVRGGRPFYVLKRRHKRGGVANADETWNVVETGDSFVALWWFVSHPKNPDLCLRDAEEKVFREAALTFRPIR